jgi:hypothetical protein
MFFLNNFLGKSLDTLGWFLEELLLGLKSYQIKTYR